MGVIIGEGKNKGVTIWTNGKQAKDNNLVFAFHGTPLTEKSANWLEIVETETRTDKKVFMPFTKEPTSSMSQSRLIEEMDKYYQLTKKDLLEAETIDVVAHSYGPIKALAFLHAIANDKTDGPKILAKVENLHLYNAMINMEYDENHGVLHNIKLFIFRIRIFFMSLLRGELNPEMPDVVKSLIDLKSDIFKPTTFIAYNPGDLLTPSSEPFMEQVRSNLKYAGVSCSVRDDSKVHRYPEYGGDHSTGSGIVERFERNKAKTKEREEKWVLHNKTP